MVNTTIETYRKVHFAVMAIEASAKRQNIAGVEMHQRLFRHYDLLHTQSLDWVIDDTIETLKNWEQEAKEGKRRTYSINQTSSS